MSDLLTFSLSDPSLSLTFSLSLSLSLSLCVCVRIFALKLPLGRAVVLRGGPGGQPGIPAVAKAGGVSLGPADDRQRRLLGSRPDP